MSKPYSDGSPSESWYDPPWLYDEDTPEIKCENCKRYTYLQELDPPDEDDYGNYIYFNDEYYYCEFCGFATDFYLELSGEECEICHKLFRIYSVKDSKFRSIDEHLDETECGEK